MCYRLYNSQVSFLWVNYYIFEILRYLAKTKGFIAALHLRVIWIQPTVFHPHPEREQGITVIN